MNGHIRHPPLVKEVTASRSGRNTMTTPTATTPTATEQANLRSRLPNPAALIPELGQIGGALFKATGNGSLPQTTVGLVQLRAGQIVGNTYLTVLHTGNLRKA